MDKIPAYAQLNARIKPLQRGEWFEDPLAEAFEQNGFGEVTGGGTLQREKGGEIIYCGIDIDFPDIVRGVPFVCDFLTGKDAPKGSKLLYENEGRKIEVPFGEVEGLAIYLNGTDLPEAVYRSNDVNELVDQVLRLLGKCGALQGYWEGPRETALYLYGQSAEEMQRLLAALLAEHPLCQRSRVIRIA
ncbi:MAG: hypothetical protein ACE15C_00765 [Phycisphaerae bacterium]